MLLRLLIFTLFLGAMNVFSQTAPAIETGVSQTLAKWRAANYSDVRYKLNITLEKGAPLMKGDIEISVNLTDEGAKNDLILDWRTTQFANDKDKPFADVVSVNMTVMGKATQSATYDYQTTKEHLLISHRFFKAGENVIKIKFASPIKTSGAAITRYVDKEDGAEYVYSLFVPSDASTAFPVFDQPDLKAKFSLQVYMPSSWKIVSNANITSVESFDISKILIRFEATKPISTYVFAFAAGEFAEFENKDSFTAEAQSSRGGSLRISQRTSATSPRLGGENSLQSKIYVRKSQAEKFKQHAAETFRLNREAVKYLESYFDYKFPFPKYDLVLIPEFPFGGMEHAGATFLREDRVIFPTEPTKNDFVTRANLIFHEAAHQWFGDTVTMRWFDDLWLKEGFAEFMAYKTLEKVMPEYNSWKIFYERNKQAAYLTDSTKGTTPIYQEIPNLSSAKSAYGNIVYRKAPSFLKQAEFYLGVDKFQTAVRAFLKKHQFKNAEWKDLVKEFNKVYDRQGLPEWAEYWVKQKGVPIIRISINKDKAHYEKSNERASDGSWSSSSWTVPSLGLIQTSISTNEPHWGMSFKTLYRYGNASEIVDTDLYGQSDYGGYLPRIFDKEKNFNRNYPTPDFIFPNYQDYGYGIFLLDEKSRDYVQKNIQNEPDDFLRTMMWGSLWDSVREAEFAPQDYVELVIKNINVETDESTIQTLLNRVSTAMTYYLSDAQSKEFAPRIENVLLNRMAKAETAGQRITFYRAFLNHASTDAAKKELKDILANNGKISIAVDVETKIEIDAIRLVPISLTLKTKDKFDIVTRLLILNDADAPQLLTALKKSETSDEAKRYAYAARAGIGTAENKAKFWTDFVGNKELSESWIEAAFVSFNSPRHSELTLPYLEKSLAELPNLKRSRKIFFVNGWLAAFIGGQRSEQALAIVNKFLADNPNLDKDLRLKILENSDNLERAVKIRGKFAR